MASHPCCLCGRSGSACPHGIRVSPHEHPMDIRNALRKKADTGLFEHGRVASRGPGGQAGLDRTGDSIHSADPDIHRRTRRLFDYHQCDEEQRVWPEEFIPRLRLLGEIFVNALERRQNRLDLEEQLRFEMVLAEISGRFVNLPVDRVDSEIMDAERRICELPRPRYFGDLAVVVRAAWCPSSSPTTTASRTVRNLPDAVERYRFSPGSDN